MAKTSAIVSEFVFLGSLMHLSKETLSNYFSFKLSNLNSLSSIVLSQYMRIGKVQYLCCLDRFDVASMCTFRDENLRLSVIS